MSEDSEDTMPHAALDATARSDNGAAETPTAYPTYRVAPGSSVDLSTIDPNESEGYTGKADVKPELKRHRKRIEELQARLYAEHQQSLLVVLQAMDTGGKDGAIRGVFEGVNPQGCEVTSFKQPSTEELDHDFLWRYHERTPRRGMIGIFNRSHYEDVLIVRVQSLVPAAVWEERYAAINAFEELLTRNRTMVLKFYLHISKDEQQRRLQSRLNNPDKNWKFDPADLRQRERWDNYTAAYEDAISRCSTAAAPWHVVPANHKWYRNLVIARTIASTLEAMDPHFPPPAPGLDKIIIPD